MLHVLNGDAARHPFARSGLAGEVAVWGDMLSEGPVPGKLRADADWAARAAALERGYDIHREAYVQGARQRLRALEAASKHDEVVLWFEQDLFCLVNLAHVLWRLEASPPRRLGLVMPEEPIGPKEAPAFARLFERRADALELLDHGARLWEAYCDPDPLPLAALAQATNRFPFWERGLHAHLARFPGTRDGLSTAERVALEALDGGETSFGELFAAAGEDPRLRAEGSGDLAFAAMLRGLAEGPGALVALADAGDRRLRMDEVVDWLVERTPRGDAVRRGEADGLEGRVLDRWLGGAHLGPRVWRWDARAARLVPG